MDNLRADEFRRAREADRGFVRDVWGFRGFVETETTDLPDQLDLDGNVLTAGDDDSRVTVQQQLREPPFDVRLVHRDDWSGRETSHPLTMDADQGWDGMWTVSISAPADIPLRTGTVRLTWPGREPLDVHDPLWIRRRPKVRTFTFRRSVDPKGHDVLTTDLAGEAIEAHVGAKEIAPQDIRSTKRSGRIVLHLTEGAPEGNVLIVTDDGVFHSQKPYQPPGGGGVP